MAWLGQFTLTAAPSVCGTLLLWLAWPCKFTLCQHTTAPSTPVTPHQYPLVPFIYVTSLQNWECPRLLPTSRNTFSKFRTPWLRNLCLSLMPMSCMSLSLCGGFTTQYSTTSVLCQYVSVLECPLCVGFYSRHPLPAYHNTLCVGDLIVDYTLLLLTPSASMP